MYLPHIFSRYSSRVWRERSYFTLLVRLISYALRSLMYFCVFTAKCEGDSHVLTRITAPGGSWRFLTAPGDSWRLLAASGGSWRLLAAPGGSWRCLAALGGSWWFLEALLAALLAPGGAPAGSWRPLAAPGGFSRARLCEIAKFVTRAEYREYAETT